MPETQKFIICGGKKLKGEVEIRGAKNAAFPVLCASLLTKEPCVIENLPLVEDVFKMLRIIERMGAEVSWLGKRTIKIKCAKIDPSKIPYELVGFLRGSILLLGPLLSRFGKLEIPPPGGCMIGARPIDSHLDAFSQLGTEIKRVPSKISKKSSSSAFLISEVYYFRKTKNKPQEFHTASFLKEKEKKAREVVLREFSVTSTENVLLFSALQPQKTIIKIADFDYQVQELVSVLRKMGVSIEEKEGHTLEVRGAKNLKGFRHKLISDPIETGTFIIASLITKGEVLLKEAQLSFLDLFLKRLYDFGAKFKILDEHTIKIFPSKHLKIDKIQSLPYPGIHTDLQPELGVLATQTEGPTLIHDPLFEGRLRYLDELNKMGADIIFCGPHRAVVYGPTVLTGIEIPSPDLRAGAALILAGLIAKGKTIINNIYQIDRGYERIEQRLQKLGADIKRITL